eukprot:CAMPEP_0183363362 /NCGR_PEP_ID=MMETSP0164_2-20130417/74831_1 /TAXON_ID=221442 /ORGANISM="Coccolithus pelagicus ssp braarudi, Strain PLY182g" /LENGTH=62 /DNA_ID=CAMNT_0025538445 /DNA_START=463 /DNA_END=648 /DNA_ORIENTATION=+
MQTAGSNRDAHTASMAAKLGEEKKHSMLKNLHIPPSAIATPTQKHTDALEQRDANSAHNECT